MPKSGLGKLVMYLLAGLAGLMAAPQTWPAISLGLLAAFCLVVPLLLLAYLVRAIKAVLGA